MALYRYFKVPVLLLVTAFLTLSCANVTIDNSEVEFGERKYDSWTFMFYIEADNNLEGSLIYDIYEMYRGYQENVNIIILIDRSSGHSTNLSLLGANFTDTRLFRVTKSGMVRLSGGAEFPEITTSSTYEANMGDPINLKRFIEFSKANYPAKNYALIIGSHGGGSRSGGLGDKTRQIVTDEDPGDGSVRADSLFTAEISDMLGPEHSVDFLGLDACYMGGIELAYQYRPGNGDFNARVLVASGPEEWGNGWKYDEIFRRVSGGGESAEVETLTGGFEPRYNPDVMTAEQFARIVVEEYDDASDTSYHSLGAYDLTKVEVVKKRVDELALLLSFSGADIESITGKIDLITKKVVQMNYFSYSPANSYLNFPYFDLYELCESFYNHFGASDPISIKALEVMSALDEMTLYSFAEAPYVGFERGKNGISIFVSNSSNFSNHSWYSPARVNSGIDTGYGKLAWCIDGGVPGNAIVNNWFELMDTLFDSGNSNNYTP